MVKVQNNNWYIWLPILALVAMPFGRSVELFVLIMSLLGLTDLIRNQNQIRQNDAFKLFSMVFLLFWVPGLISLVDAVNIERSSENIGGMLRFYLAGVFIISRIDTVQMHQKIGVSFAAVVTFWAIDGWLQASTGVDIFGMETSNPTRISGIFGENARLGLMIIPFFSVAVFSLKKQYGASWAIAVGMMLASTILLSGDRAAWVSLVVTLFLYLMIFRKKLSILTFKQVALIFVVLSLAVVSVLNSSQFQQRIESVTVGFDGSYDSINKASSSRLPLWETAYKMFMDNPINGVGARSFRYAYPDYASSDDPFVDFSLPREDQKGQTHAHQVVLEFASETGVLGLVGYVVVLWFIYIKWLPLAARSEAMIPLGYVVSLIVIFFPLNTHQAFFSSHWGQIVWMIIALAISSLSAECGANTLRLKKRVNND